MDGKITVRSIKRYRYGIYGGCKAGDFGGRKLRVITRGSMNSISYLKTLVVDDDVAKSVRAPS